MSARIDVSHNILDQFSSQLGVERTNGVINLNSEIGTGSAWELILPGQLELYHFSFTLSQPFEMSSTNPVDSDWLLININISESHLEKKVNQSKLSLQKHLPSGMLLYSPGTEIYSLSPRGIPFSVALIRFHKSLLSHYPNLTTGLNIGEKYSIIYEDLDFVSETLLRKAIERNESLMLIHAYVLEILGIFFGKLKQRTTHSVYDKIHPQDLKALFQASALLRDPEQKDLPSVEKLAKMANMGTTKFNTSFKQVFGTTPIQYNLKIKMEYARDLLSNGQAGPSEISYQLGYSHPSKFTSAFKKQFGILPSEL